MQNSGYIYKITNLVNGKIYIGQTKHTVEKRWKQHQHAMNRKNCEYPITRALKKYGVENFKIEEIWKTKNLSLMEMYFVKLFNSMLPNGYNCTTNKKRYKSSKETRQKISKAGKGRPAWNKGISTGPMSEESKLKSAIAHSKPIKRTDLVTGEIKYYSKIRDVEQEGFITGAVSMCCGHPFKYKSHKGYKWEYIDKKHIKQLEPSPKKHNPTRFKKGQSSHNSKPVTLINIFTGKIYNFTSISSAARFLNLEPENFRMRLKKSNKYKQFVVGFTS